LARRFRCRPPLLGEPAPLLGGQAAPYPEPFAVIHGPLEARLADQAASAHRLLRLRWLPIGREEVVATSAGAFLVPCRPALVEDAEQLLGSGPGGLQ
jgi:hypothetical protein